MIEIGWSHFQSARYKPLKLCLICRCGLPGVISSNLKKEPTASPVLTKWWKLELTLGTNFGSHAQMVTKFGSQILATKFGFVPDWLVKGFPGVKWDQIISRLAIYYAWAQVVNCLCAHKMLRMLFGCLFPELQGKEGNKHKHTVRKSFCRHFTLYVLCIYCIFDIISP